MAVDLSIKLNGVTIADDAGTLAFGGAVGVNKGRDVELVITNDGNEALTLGTITLGGTDAAMFTMLSLPAGTVATGGSTKCRVRFMPPSTGAKSGTFSIVTNHEDTKNPYNFALTGTGIAAGASAHNAMLQYMFALGMEELEENVGDDDVDPVDVFFDFLNMGVPESAASVLGPPAKAAA